MMWWSYDVVASQCSQSYLCGLWSLSLIIINLFLSVSSVVSGLSLLFSVVSGSQVLVVWWSYLCGGVVVGLTDNRSQ